MRLLDRLPVATPSPSRGVGTGREARLMSGCKGSYSLGVGEGLPACLWVSEFRTCVVFVPPHPLLRLLFF